LYPYLTEEEIQFLEKERQQIIDKMNNSNSYCNSNKSKFRYKSKPVIAVAVKKTSIQVEKDRIACLNFLRQRMRDADPILRKSFMDKVEGVEF
jgi:hypothetical protein